MSNRRNWRGSKLRFSLTENLKWRVSCMWNGMPAPFISRGRLFWRYDHCLVNVEYETLNFPLSFILWDCIWRVKRCFIQSVYCIKGVILLDYVTVTLTRDTQPPSCWPLDEWGVIASFHSQQCGDLRISRSWLHLVFFRQLRSATPNCVIVNLDCQLACIERCLED